MRGLGGSDKVYAAIRKRRRLGSPGDAGKIWKRRQQPLARRAHFRVWFNPENWIAILQQLARPNARPGSDIGDHMARREAALRSKSLQHSRWISRTIENVVFYAIRESAGSVRNGHVIREWQVFSCQNTILIAG